MAEEKKGFIAEFKEFITKGNVIDMAVGVIIGGAFSSIINSLVNDIFSPILGLLIHNVDLANLKYVFVEGTEEVAEVAIRYGAFIQNIITFLFQALVIFLFVKAVNKVKEAANAKALAEAAAKEAEEAAEAEAAEEEAKRKAEEPVELLREILAALKKE